MPSLRPSTTASRHINYIQKPIRSFSYRSGPINGFYKAQNLPPDDNLRSRAVVIRPWKGRVTLLHALAFAKKLESEHGPVQYLSLPKNKANPNEYLPFFFAIFKDSSSLQKIPKTEQSANISPIYAEWSERLEELAQKNGGPSFDVIEPFLSSDPKSTAVFQSSSATWDEYDEGVTVEALVSRNMSGHLWLQFPRKSGMPYIPFERRKVVAYAMLGFGGFAPEPGPTMQKVLEGWREQLHKYSKSQTPFTPYTSASMSKMIEEEDKEAEIHKEDAQDEISVTENQDTRPEDPVLVSLDDEVFDDPSSDRTIPSNTNRSNDKVAPNLSETSSPETGQWDRWREEPRPFTGRIGSQIPRPRKDQWVKLGPPSYLPSSTWDKTGRKMKRRMEVEEKVEDVMDKEKQEKRRRDERHLEERLRAVLEGTK